MLKAQLAAKQQTINTLKVKNSLVQVALRISIPSLVVLGIGWTSSFMVGGKLTVVPELNGPDYKVTYQCENYEKMKGLHMEDHGDSVTVNYGAFGRRRGLRKFNCN